MSNDFRAFEAAPNPCLYFKFHHCCELEKLGAVFENDSNFEKSSQMLQYAIDDANENILGKTDLKLAVEIEQLAYGREYLISRKVCNLLEVIKPLL